MQKQPEANNVTNVQELIKNLFNTQLNIERKKRSIGRTAELDGSPTSEKQNQQIQNLDIEDYLQLFAHQKKHLSNLRWKKMIKINQSLKMEQESFKNFFAIASHSNYRRLEHPGYYKQLLASKSQYPAIFFISIEKDIPRTLSNTHPFQQSLRNVLCAYAIRNPSLLYCQGINYLIAYLLINEMSQEQAFWFLACLVQNIMPDDYYRDLTTVSIVTCIFNQILEQLFPEFQLQMMDVGMDSSVFLVPWFVCLFSKGFINSVSAYIINYLLLESRNYKVGFILLKISIALIAIVLTRQQPFSYIKQFRCFKETLQTKIFQISLHQIKEELQIIQINYDVYVKLQDHYRKQKQQTRQIMLKSRDGKKLPLPVCNKQYPICFHRIQMQKRMGSIQNALVLKNGYNIIEQYEQNYLDRDLSQEEASINISYSDINQCQIGRQVHICHLNAQDYQAKVELRKSKFNRETIHKIELLDESQQSLDQNVNVSTIECKFAELSQYFVVDQNYQVDQSQDMQCQEELQKQFEQYSVQKKQSEQLQNNKVQTPKKSVSVNVQAMSQQQNSLRAVVGKSWKKVWDKINIFKKLKENRLSKAQIQENK